MLQIRYDTSSHPILTSTPYTFIFPGLYVLNFRWPRHGIMASSSDSSCFGLYTDLNVCTKYSYTGQILNSRPESCVCWLLSLKFQACQMDSERFIPSVWGKWVWKLWGQWISSIIFSFLTCPIKIISPTKPSHSSGVILDHSSVLGETFHFSAFWLWQRLDCSVTIR